MVDPVSTPAAASDKITIGMIGCGNMGGALLRSWCESDMIQSGVIVDPSELPEKLLSYENLFHVKRLADADFESCDVIVLAVKPQIMNHVCTDLADHLTGRIPGEGTPLILSIAAGIPVAQYQDWLPNGMAIVRSMPNTPASVGAGMTALYANINVSEDQKNSVYSLFTAAGQVLWLNDEGLMDAVTAISGSGPAYVFYLVEALAKAAEAMGLPADQAMILARQTMIGGGALLDTQKDIGADILRQNVTSPGGTTAAGLAVLMDGRLQEILIETAKAAKNRGHELSKPV